MARRGDLKSIAVDVSRSFVGRNNDVDGYWAIGKLHRWVYEERQSQLMLDLLAPVPLALHWFSQNIGHYRRMVERLAQTRGVKLQSALIELVFGGEERDGNSYYRCSLSVADARGKSWTLVSRGLSWPHDPAKESRRGRSDQ